MAGSEPLYIQVCEKIKEDIKKGKIKYKLPTQREMCEEYYVSRSTIIDAIKQLEKEEIVICLQGKGIYIRYDPIQISLDTTKSIEEFLKYNIGADNKVVVDEIVTPDAEVRSIMNISSDIKLRRIVVHKLFLDRIIMYQEMFLYEDEYDIDVDYIVNEFEQYRERFNHSVIKVKVSKFKPEELSDLISPNCFQLDRFYFDNEYKLKFYTFLKTPDNSVEFIHIR